MTMKNRIQAKNITWDKVASFLLVKLTLHQIYKTLFTYYNGTETYITPNR